MKTFKFIELSNEYIRIFLKGFNENKEKIFQNLAIIAIDYLEKMNLNINTIETLENLSSLKYKILFIFKNKL